jgi:hypothetical protein
VCVQNVGRKLARRTCGKLLRHTTSFAHSLLADLLAGLLQRQLGIMCAPLSAQPVPRNSGLQLGDHLGATQIISAPRRPRAATRRPSARRTAQCLPRPSSAGRQLIECAVQVVGAPVVPPLPPVAQVVRGVGGSAAHNTSCSQGLRPSTQLSSSAASSSSRLRPPSCSHVSRISCCSSETGFRACLCPGEPL